MKQNVKQNFETLAVAVLCTVFVLSMQQSCSGLSKQMNKKQEKTEIKKAQDLKKNETIKKLSIGQKIR